MEYLVEVHQINEFYIEADNEEEARRIATEEYIWDEAQTYPNIYEYVVHVSEVEKQNE
tara:strand:- start:190 stop:363 length:174 start_codon:yes stop_codon:yes gene_type:complete